MHVKVGGTWREVLEGWIKVGGTWQQFFAGLTFTLSVTSISDTDAATATASILVERGGNLSFGAGNITVGDSAAEWVSPQSATVGDDYEARITVNSGVSPTVGSAGVWTPLTSDQTWSVVRVTSGTNTGNWTLEIRDAGTLSVVASTTFDISATVSP